MSKQAPILISVGDVERVRARISEARAAQEIKRLLSEEDVECSHPVLCLCDACTMAILARSFDWCYDEGEYSNA